MKIILIALALLINATAVPLTKGKKVEFELIRFSGNQFKSVGILKTNDGLPNIRVLYDIYEGLVRLDRFGKVQLALASSYTVSSDKKTYTFNLRDNLKWSDGSALKASDCLFGIQHFLNPEVGISNSYLTDSILNSSKIREKKLPITSLGVKVINDNQIQFSLEYPNPKFVDILTNINFACLNPKDFNKNGTFKSGNLPLTNSAYKIVSSNHWSRVNLERNLFYYNEKKVLIDKVTYFDISDMQSQINIFLTGQATLTLPNLASSQISVLRNRLGNQVFIGPSLSVIFMHLNIIKKPFVGNKELRKAISLVINRDHLAENILSTGELGVYDFIPPMYSKYRTTLFDWQSKSYEERIAEAKKTLESLGYSNKNPLVISLKYPLDPDFDNIAHSIEDVVEKNLPIIIKPVNKNINSFVNEKLNANFEITLDKWNSSSLDPFEFADFLLNEPSFNLKEPMFKDFKKMLDEAKKETDEDTRYLKLSKVMHTFLENYSVIPLVTSMNKYLSIFQLKGHSTRNVLARILSQDLYFDNNDQLDEFSDK